VVDENEHAKFRSETEATDAWFLRRVLLRDYRSIAACDVRLRPLTLMVGANGAGKSNVLDALRFVADGLRASLEYAMRRRGGADEVLRRGARDRARFGIRLDFLLPETGPGYYAFSIAVRSLGGFVVEREECVVDGSEASGVDRSFFRVREGVVETSAPVAPPVTTGRLYLVNAAGLPAFRPAYDALSRMAVYSITPERLREPQSPDAGELLERSGGNITTVLERMAARDMETHLRVGEYLESIVPGVRRIDVVSAGNRLILQLRQQAPTDARVPWRFPAASMSDGTLRALGILVALFQSPYGAADRVRLVGIEEPEAGLHPAAAGVLLDALQEAALRTQVIATTHSADLLDHPGIEPESMLEPVMHFRLLGWGDGDEETLPQRRER
jgi:predicted ATPase